MVHTKQADSRHHQHTCAHRHTVTHSACRSICRQREPDPAACLAALASRTVTTAPACFQNTEQSGYCTWLQGMHRCRHCTSATNALCQSCPAGQACRTERAVSPMARERLRRMRSWIARHKSLQLAGQARAMSGARELRRCAELVCTARCVSQLDRPRWIVPAFECCLPISLATASFCASLHQCVALGDAQRASRSEPYAVTLRTLRKGADADAGWMGGRT